MSGIACYLVNYVIWKTMRFQLIAFNFIAEGDYAAFVALVTGRGEFKDIASPQAKLAFGIAFKPDGAKGDVVVEQSKLLKFQVFASRAQGDFSCALCPPKISEKGKKAKQRSNVEKVKHG
tara:strand:- start:698 stop:1057 length:360 start_codon:yes stop_codon:yes gene_type:complete